MLEVNIGNQLFSDTPWQINGSLDPLEIVGMLVVVHVDVEIVSSLHQEVGLKLVSKSVFLVHVVLWTVPDKLTSCFTAVLKWTGWAVLVIDNCAIVVTDCYVDS